MKTSKQNLFRALLTLICLFTLGLVPGAFSESLKLDMVTLTGRALVSFESDHYLVQTKSYVYKILKQELGSEIVLKLNNASATQKELTIAVPQRAIVYLWPMQPNSADQNAAEKFNKMTSALRQEAKERNGKVTLKGKAMYSFSDSFALIQVNEKVYQISKDLLSPDQKSQLSTIGGRAQLELPKHAVVLSWTFTSRPERAIASVEKSDQIVFKHDGVALSGTVLCSFDEQLILLQSGNTMFQIKKSLIADQVSKANKAPGSRLDLLAPLNSIEFIWSADATKPDFSRAPASAP